MEFLENFLVWLGCMDEWLLLQINGCHLPFFDQLMWVISDRYVWVPFYIALTLCVVWKRPWQHSLLCLVIIGLTITAADQFCATLLRPIAERMRPSNLNNPVSALVHVVNGYRGGRYGFPSCHAANTFALATFLSLFFRKRWATLSLMAWAAVVSFSRIYLGVHYPGDIFVGMVIGGGIAWLFFRLYSFAVAEDRIQNMFKVLIYFCCRKSNSVNKSRI